MLAVSLPKVSSVLLRGQLISVPGEGFYSARQSSAVMAKVWMAVDTQRTSGGTGAFIYICPRWNVTTMDGSRVP